MNPALFANPALFQAYQNDPGMAYGQALMQQGASTAPVRSPLEGFARALTAGVGGFTQSRVKDRYTAQDEKYRQGLAAALKGDDILTALSGSQDPSLQALGLQMQIESAKSKQAAKYQLQNDLASKGLTLNPDGSVTPIQGFGTALGGIQNEQTIAGIPGKVAEGQAMIPVDVQKQQALIPGEVSKATQVAQATAPIEAAKDIGVYNATQALQNKFSNTDKLRDDFRNDPNVKNYQTVVPIYKSMVDAAGRNSRAADLNLVYGMAKIFDPTSVVREGEQVLVTSTASLPDQLVGMINRLNGGEALRPDTRRALLTEAKSRVDQAEGLYNQTKDFFAQNATSAGIDPNKVFFDVGSTPDAPGSAGGPQTRPKVLTYNPKTGKME